MNIEDIIRWATQCKMPYDYVTGEIVQIEKLQAFAALVAAAKEAELNDGLTIAYMDGYEKGKDAGAAAEREACAKVCNQLADDMTLYAQWGANTCATQIRARGRK